MHEQADFVGGDRGEVMLEDPTLAVKAVALLSHPPVVISMLKWDGTVETRGSSQRKISLPLHYQITEPGVHNMPLVMKPSLPGWIVTTRPGATGFSLRATLTWLSAPKLGVRRFSTPGAPMSSSNLSVARAGEPNKHKPQRLNPENATAALWNTVKNLFFAPPPVIEAARMGWNWFLLSLNMVGCCQRGRGRQARGQSVPDAKPTHAGARS